VRNECASYGLLAETAAALRQQVEQLEAAVATLKRRV